MAESEFKDLEELGINCNNASIDELTEKFTIAADHLKSFVSKLDTDTLLNLYGLYKQGLEGDCNISKPSWYDMKAKQKWEAWNKLKNMPQDEAKIQYINLIKKIDPNFDFTKNSESKDTWVTVSTLNHSEEIVNELDKTIFDYVKERNVQKVEELLRSMSNVNSLDSDGMGLIHWATDRGFIDMLNILLKHNLDVNLKDADGQTALHYSSSCGHFDCTELLLKNDADSKIVDGDGFDCVMVASDDAIKSLIIKYQK